jgi:hypothetical protein
MANVVRLARMCAAPVAHWTARSTAGLEFALITCPGAQQIRTVGQ